MGEESMTERLEQSQVPISMLRERIRERWGLGIGALGLVLSCLGSVYISDVLANQAGMEAGMRTLFKGSFIFVASGMGGMMGWAFGRNPIGESMAEREYPLGIHYPRMIR